MYEKLYHLLFNAITDALRALEDGKAWEMKRILMDAQCKAEELYITYEEDGGTGRIVEIFGSVVENSVENVKKS